MRLEELKPSPGARKKSKRVGRGPGSGSGKTAGKGHKGQKARSGGSIRLGFEGGQMPLIRRLPKRGFNNAAFKTRYAIVNLDDLEALTDGTAVDEALLRKEGLVRGQIDGVKILARGALTKKLTITGAKCSEAARRKIEAAGGAIS